MTRLVAALLLLWSAPALAHDHWIAHGNYKGPDGVHCCGPNDCFPVDAHEVRGGFMIEVADEFVPTAEVQPSRDGHFWRCKKADGSRRCFFAPPPNS